MVAHNAEPVHLFNTPAPVCLHVFPSFGIGGVPLRMARIFNDLGADFQHHVIALDGVADAQIAIGRAIHYSIVSLPQQNRALISRLLNIRRALQRLEADLLITYNWGSIEWAMANRLFVRLPHIHHEAGFGKEEATQQLGRRVHLRRSALRASRQIVVPSRTLERIALQVWRLPKHRVIYLPNGIDDKRFAGARASTRYSQNARPIVIGSLAPLRPEKNIGRLLRAFAIAHQYAPVRLLIAGEGTERPRLESEARALNVTQSVQFLGSVDPEAFLSGLDILALSSDTEQMPNAVLEAMASALPVASLDVGDVRTMVASENAPFVVPRDDGNALGHALIALAGQPQLRHEIGLANLARVRQEFSHTTMVDRWRTILNDAIGRSMLAEQAHKTRC
jgi:glycosyltransferase involved in cell wall biosynthesis